MTAIARIYVPPEYVGWAVAGLVGLLLFQLWIGVRTGRWSALGLLLNVLSLLGLVGI